MTNGKPCGLSDGHNGQHRSPEAVARRRDATREYDRRRYEQKGEEKRAYEREHYWTLSPLAYARKRLNDRRWQALRRMARRNKR